MTRLFEACSTSILLISNSKTLETIRARGESIYGVSTSYLRLEEILKNASRTEYRSFSWFTVSAEGDSLDDVVEDAFWILCPDHIGILDRVAQRSPALKEGWTPATPCFSGPTTRLPLVRIYLDLDIPIVGECGAKLPTDVRRPVSCERVGL